MSPERMFASISLGKDVKFGCFPLMDGVPGRMHGQLHLWRARITLESCAGFAAFSCAGRAAGSDVVVEATYSLCPVVSLEEGPSPGVHDVGQAYFLSRQGVVMAQQPILDWRCPVGGCLMRCRNALVSRRRMRGRKEGLPDLHDGEGRTHPPCLSVHNACATGFQAPVRCCGAACGGVTGEAG